VTLIEPAFDPFGPVPPLDLPCGVNFGGGVNSTALLLIMHDQGFRPDWVVFSDTGSERPETYENVEIVEKWCKKVGFPFATTRWTRKDGSFEPVHANCLRLAWLPSKAYGFSGCTTKWKIQPLQKWRKEHGFTPSTVCIGYDAGEERRLKKAKARHQCQGMDPEKSMDEVVWYPLVGWGIDRKLCVDRILAQGWLPSKSACFCCPSAKPAEWVALRKDYPELFDICKRIQTTAEEAGHAESKNLFRAYDPANPTCVCTADGCLVRTL
jgi:hypothetical protein